MNDPIVTTPPTPAAPSAAPSPADAQAQIDALMRTPEYQRSDRATVDLVQQWHQYKEHGRVLEPELSDRPAELATPVGFEVPAHVVEDASQTIRSLGLGARGQRVYEFCLGRCDAPTLPADYRPPDPDLGWAKLQESEGAYAARVLDDAHDAVSVLDALRVRAGRPPGELRKFLDQSGAGNDVNVIRFFSRLGGRFKVTDGPLMADAARRRGRAR